MIETHYTKNMQDERRMLTDVFVGVYLMTSQPRPDLPERYSIFKDGRDVFNSTLPRDFNYRNGDVVIVDGILKHGAVTKFILNDIINFIAQTYGGDVAGDFINNIRYVALKWLKTHKDSF